MSVYMTEEEQIEAIKKWWKRYSTLITVMISVILLAIAGYRYWSWHQQKVLLQASNTYEQMMLAFSHQNDKAVKSFANQLIKNYKNTVYADVAHLTLAKLLIKNNKLNLAKDELYKVVENSKINALKQLARLRQARILLQQKSYDKALAELKIIDDSAYLAIINELKGDLFAATGKYQKAIESYRLAMDESKDSGTSNLFLEMKTNEVASMTQSFNEKNERMQVG
ncbi:YfgM family protein [Legionella israelensis]|uniref:Ancillary SecYEG translocon subunit n=1 Tax=Legionella israelensis TaxID=454 RepID=A0A0W0VGZ4_9GAMM|nr:tetratricopeptide repeat protein [Legionella israelensis]KTD19377.1 transmembrane protein [Legionella israelensis]QBS08651.1 tetratricopeptide repeat protein [Legionella israelensis]QDP72514.1 tetratricopeptide repeat protein [Legionella israelensis]SCY10089.1 Putative negative regulator of RcsB-dependent stress response [Legionella israelensis DSM 19235]STX58314.1 transmembrane protein [Legionella israelensis]